jgi:hypothetical protein
MSRTPQPFPKLVVRQHDPQRTRRRVAAVALAWLITLGAALVAGWYVGLRPRGVDPAELASQRSQNELLQQRVAVLERADQIDRVASVDLQQTLREREEEIAGLRADIAFYSRLVGGGARREGLAVHSLRVAPVRDSHAWNVSVTLTQNLKRSQVSSGRLTLAIEGVENNQLKVLAWSDLAGAADTGGLPFSFKYFQQVTGTVMLPDGFSPNRVRVTVDAGGDGHIEQGFAWAEAQATEENSDVQQQENSRTVR